MKKLLLSFAFCLGLGFTAQAQTVVKDASGNYVQVKKDSVSKAVKIGQTFTNSKGQVFDLYKGARGGLYYIRTNKEGKEVKTYLKAQ
ncbi:hypothetical protein [Sphingobacterium mizutaii]|uniref:hypothetical protein n=1 Tax=Sphingobacterium mizutaii TaxID=1010 RepID=UPI00289B32C1|nr:hypothetical protein [Sphingobacterium mizutaii]